MWIRIALFRWGIVRLNKDMEMSRQQCAFSKESTKYAGCGILKRNFYTRFIPVFKKFGLWHGGKVFGKYDIKN